MSAASSVVPVIHRPPSSSSASLRAARARASRQRRHLAEPFLHRLGRRAAPRAPAGMSVMTPAVGRDLRAFPDRDVVGKADPPPSIDVISDRRSCPRCRSARRSRNAGRSRRCGDLHQVVDLGALADHRVADRAAVDRGVGADLDVVLDDDAADLRDLAVAARAQQIAEAVLTDAAAGMDDDAVADQRVDDGRARADRRSRGRSARPGRSRQSGADHGAGADLGARTDHRAGIDRDAAFEPRRRMHQRARRDAARLEQRGRAQRAGKQRPRDRDERPVGLARDQHGDVRAALLRRSVAVVRQTPARVAASCAGVFRVLDESEIGRARRGRAARCR